MLQIYLDWNIITNLVNPESILDKKIRAEFEFLKNIFEDKNSTLVTPYSNAHLKDLMTSYNKGERERVTNSLSYISKLTKNVCLTQYWEESNARWHSRNPIEFFDAMLKDDSGNLDSWENLLKSLKEFGAEKMFDSFRHQPHGMDFSKIEKHNPFLASLFPISKQENTMYATIQDVFNTFSKATSSPTVYKELRKMFKDEVNIDTNISNLDNTIEQLDNYFPKTMVKKTFTELYELNSKNRSKNQDYDKLISVYMMLDFVGYNSDKLSKKNKYTNIFNDALHCFYAAHCDIYLTNDNKNYKKSKAVFESEKIATTVYKITEFVNMMNTMHDL